ncbi:MAG: hypothetical protein ACRET0_04475, partial [Steroidobacteraceae bacterium]
MPQYPAGVTADIDLFEFTSLKALIEDAFTRSVRPNRPLGRAIITAMNAPKTNAVDIWTFTIVANTDWPMP